MLEIAAELLMVAAVFVAPIVAVRAQREIDRRRAKHDRRLDLFRMLMGTRGAKLSANHVNALNSIDVEFYGQKSVTDAWKEYLDHLNTQAGETETAHQMWVQRSDDLLVDLLYQMANELGYDFDRPHLRRAIYVPKAFGDEEAYQRGMRLAMAQLFTGRYALPVRVVVDAPAPTGGGGGDDQQAQPQPDTA